MEVIPDNWLITGGCGFIGTSLIAYLLKEKPKINLRVLDNLSVGTRENISDVVSFSEKEVSLLKHPEGVELVIGNIRDYETCLKCCEGIDIVVHLAANTGVNLSVENPRVDMQSNVIGVFNMLEAARMKKVERFIFASSGAPLGEVEPPVHEEKAPKPVSPYGASKLVGEGYCSAYYRTFGIKAVSLRFGNVYGPLSKHKNSVVAKFFKKVLAGETLEIYGDGNQTRDFIYINDLIQAIMLAVNANVGGEVFQIATYKETSVNEIAKIVSKLVKEKVGKGIKITHSSPRLGDVRRNYSDITKAKKILGFNPKWSIENGIEETFKWFLKEYGYG